MIESSNSKATVSSQNKTPDKKPNHRRTDSSVVMMNPEQLEAIRLQFKDGDSSDDDSMVIGEQSLEIKKEQFEGELEAVQEDLLEEHFEDT